MQSMLGAPKRDGYLCLEKAALKKCLFWSGRTGIWEDGYMCESRKAQWLTWARKYMSLGEQSEWD